MLDEIAPREHKKKSKEETNELVLLLFADWLNKNKNLNLSESEIENIVKIFLKEIES